MATFMISHNESVSVPATEICLENEYFTAWDGETRTAIFRASEIIGCWLEPPKGGE